LTALDVYTCKILPLCIQIDRAFM